MPSGRKQHEDDLKEGFDAKYSARFWRPVTAIGIGWEPLFPTPPFPEYPSAHNCHTGAITTALARFFHTDRVKSAS